MKESMHWADQTAKKIIEKNKKEEYFVATGATPSGILHVGNFREFIMGDFIARALNDHDVKGTHIHYWDDYDVFRKVPVNLPKKELLNENLRKPITSVPDIVCDKHNNYAEHFEEDFESYLPIVGLNPIIQHNTKFYQDCIMHEQMKIALEKTEKIKEILNRFRKEDLDDKWLPISLYDEETNKEAEEIEYLGDYNLKYKDSKGEWKEFDFRKKGLAKFKYRIQVPAYWHFKGIDFESAGKDHYASGGVFLTARMIAKEVYNIDYALGYGFGWIAIKGGKQFSSSKGDITTLADVLEVYQPEIIRYLFAGTKPSTEFAISFDLDVIKIYEDFDKMERIYYQNEEVSEKEQIKQKRIYELSCIKKPNKEQPFQPGIRHLTTILQIYDYDHNKVKEYFKDQVKNAIDEERLEIRFNCTKNWLEKYAPEDFKFKVVTKVESTFNGKEKKMLSELKELIPKINDEKELFEGFYEIIKGNDSDAKEFFSACYKLLINKEKGPKLAPFILEIGKDKVIELLTAAT